MSKSFSTYDSVFGGLCKRLGGSPWRRMPFTAVFLLAFAAMPCRGAEDGGPAAAEKGKPQPVFKIRELYACGHFGNSYEVMGDNECRDVLAEAKSWGFNGYHDWFDWADCRNPFVGGHSYGLGEAQLDAKTRRYAIARVSGCRSTRK